MKNTVLIFVTIANAIVTSCTQIKLSNDEAKSLIVKSLKLPVSFRHDINKRPSMGSGFELDGLRNARLITGSEYLDSRRLIEIQITEEGKSCYLGENDNVYMFKTNDIDFDQITGISINKEEQTATVRFTIKATNATRAAYALSQTDAGFSGKKYINYSLDNPLSGELVFKKFDNGWQLLSDQNKSSSDLLNQILDSNPNQQSNNNNGKIEDKFSGDWVGHETLCRIILTSDGSYKIEMSAEGNTYEHKGYLENGKLRYEDKDYQGNNVVHYFVKSSSNCIKDGFYEYCKE